MKQREYKRLRMAQSIQRELEEVAVKQADLEKEGVVVEKALRNGNSKLNGLWLPVLTCLSVNWFRHEGSITLRN